jgi:hypothetical protein
MANAEKRRPVFAAYAKGGRRLHVGLQEFGEDVSAAMSAGAAKASSAIFGGLSSLKLGASFVANAVTIKRVDPREGQGPLPAPCCRAQMLLCHWVVPCPECQPAGPCLFMAAGVHGMQDSRRRMRMLRRRMLPMRRSSRALRVD